MYATYRGELEKLPGVRPQYFAPEVEPLLWTMAVTIDDGDSTPRELELRRDAVMAAMAEDGIETRPGFYPLSKLPPYDLPHLPWSDRIAAGVTALPTHVDLSDDEVSLVCRALSNALRRV